MATKRLTPLPEHYELHLGEIARGWSDKRQPHAIQVVSFRGKPELGVTTYATLGLSRYILELSSTRKIRQELLMSANEAFSDDVVAGFVLSLAEYVAERRKALLRGEVIGPGTPVIAGSTLTAVYVTNPSPFDKSLAELTTEPPPTVFAYLIPITASEASLIRDRGWKWFEEQLERQNPDIWNLSRSEAANEA